MLFQSLPSLSALLFLLLTLVAPSPLALARNIPAAHKNLVRADAQDWTNARRLAAGLPPHPPRHMKRATPTEPNVVKRHAVPSPSPSAALASIQKLAAPEVAHTGHIEARTVENNEPLGFVQISSSGLTLGRDDSDGTPVVFTTDGSTPFSIATVGGAPTYIGGQGTQSISSGSARKATLGSVGLTTPHARPMATGGESAIWTLDAATQKLVPYWVNPDGSHPRTTLAYSESDGALVLTGDVSAYNQAHPDAQVSEVALFFVSN
ncbi:hypothetical protein C8Q74DRAFT_1373364 [Fomes fomentarius]|nr:hypothetical protein C8Q74DRAFT_1373364 [Fomes fomentarius]